MRRSEQRRAAVFAVYQQDVTGRAPDETLDPTARPFTRALAAVTIAHTEELDALIDRHAKGWAVERIAPLERAILRVALLELIHPDVLPSEEPIPPEAAIDEAVRTAKKFCSAQAPAFINGILAAALRERQEKGEVA